MASSTAKKIEEQNDFQLIRHLDQNFNLVLIIARDKSGKEVGRREIKVPRRSAPMKVWTDFCGGENDAKDMIMSDHKISVRANIKSKAKSKGSRGGANMASALS